MQVGLNLYSIRSFIKETNDFVKTCAKLKEMGYAFVQYSGAPFDSDKINLMQKQVGLPVVLTHVPMDRILNDTANLMEEHGKIGCKNIGLGMMPVATILDEQKCLQTIKLLDEAGKTMEQNGFKFFYHFHQFEFCKLSCGMRIIDYMLENCPHINFTADTYWMQFGGVDVTEYLKKMQGRIDCIHLKDYQIVYQNEKFVPRFAPLGKGNLNLNEIVKTAKQSGTKYFLVEQDDAIDYDDPLNQVKQSVTYVANKL